MTTYVPTAIGNILNRLGQDASSLTNLVSSLSGLGTDADVTGSLTNLASSSSGFVTSISTLQGQVSSVITTSLPLHLTPYEIPPFGVDGTGEYNTSNFKFPLYPFPCESNFRPFNIQMDSTVTNSQGNWNHNGILLNKGAINTLQNWYPSLGVLNEDVKSSKSLFLIDGERAEINRTDTTIRIFNNMSVSSTPASTYTAMILSPFFSFTGCSYSSLVDPGDPFSWQENCQAVAESVIGDSSTNYVFASHFGTATNSDSQTIDKFVYYAMVSGIYAKDNLYEGVQVDLAPEYLTYLKSNTKLDLRANPSLKYRADTQSIDTSSYSTQLSYFLPLLPYDDFYAVMKNNSTTQFNSRTGFGNWVTNQQIDGSYDAEKYNVSFLSLSYMGAFDMQNSYTHFDILPGQYFMFTSLTGSYTTYVGENPQVDGIYLCVSNPSSSYSCTAFSSISDSNHYFSITAHGDIISTMSDLNLFDSYSMLRGNAAVESISSSLSMIFGYNNQSLFNANYDRLAKSVGGGLRKAILLGDIQPQENLTFVRNLNFTTSLTSDSTFYRYPSILNAQNVNVESFNQSYGPSHVLTWSASYSDQTTQTNVNIFSVTCDGTSFGDGLNGFFRIVFSEPVGPCLVTNAGNWVINQIAESGDLDLNTQTECIFKITATDSNNFDLQFSFINAPDYPSYSFSTYSFSITAV